MKAVSKVFRSGAGRWLVLSLSAAILAVVGTVWAAARAGGPGWVAVPLGVMFAALGLLMAAVFRLLDDTEPARAERTAARRLRLPLHLPAFSRHLGHHAA
jgi:hypothetical protein